MGLEGFIHDQDGVVRAKAHVPQDEDHADGAVPLAGIQDEEATIGRRAPGQHRGTCGTTRESSAAKAMMAPPGLPPRHPGAERGRQAQKNPPAGGSSCPETQL